MDYMSLAVRTVLSKYATFDGRASRPEYWWWLLSVLIFSVFCALIDGAVVAPMLGFERFAEDAGQPVGVIFGLAIFLPMLAVSARRLHDTGRSGWWLLLNLLPIVGSLVLLYFYTRPSEAENLWGPPNPLY